MKLQRYDSVGFDLMDESPTGEFVRMEDVIELLKTRNKNKTHSEGRYCGLCEAIELIKGEQK